MQSGDKAWVFSYYGRSHQLPCLLDDGLDEGLGALVAILGTINENVADVGIRDFFLRHLDLRPTFLLQLPNRLPSLPDDQSHTLVRHRQDVGLLFYISILTFGLGGPYGVSKASSI
jgi:hypothetical protein